jgi:hypothetical protein
MAEELPVRRVEVSFVGAAPAREVRCAAGVSDVQADGSTLRCLVCGSFQPFLEALRGHEVVGFDSAPPAGSAPPPGSAPPAGSASPARPAPPPNGTSPGAA